MPNAKQHRAALRVSYTRNVMTVQVGNTARPGPSRYPSESAFWYDLKQTLEAAHTGPDGKPFDLVKKVMGKDGHLVGGDGYPYYLRDRRWRFCILDERYETRNVAKELNATGVVNLRITHWDDAPAKTANPVVVASAGAGK